MNYLNSMSPVSMSISCMIMVFTQCVLLLSQVPATTLTCVSTCDDNYNNNAVWDKVVPSCVEKDCGKNMIHSLQIMWLAVNSLQIMR